MRLALAGGPCLALFVHMSLWKRYQDHFIRYADMGISLDISRMKFPDDFMAKMEPLVKRAYVEMRDLEGGSIANPDEKRMVGHYWLRNAKLAPMPEMREEIVRDIADCKAFAGEVHAGKVAPERGGKFTHLLIVGIGGSALGPQLIADALVDSSTAPMITHFFDNTDPDGMARTLAGIGNDLSKTLTVVISKSGGTPETRNGMLVAKAAYEKAGLNFSKHAVAVTGVGSKMDNVAKSEGWLKRFPMTDWVGGRTSVMSTVGLVPMTLQGADIDALLSGAATMDEHTRGQDTSANAAMIMALMWHYVGGGKGAKDMVILPYKDRLVLLSKYLQQLVMESLGKELDLDGKKVNQGIAVYGNKGSTDQHAYVQQLREGVNNFFATFIEVRQAAPGPQVEVEPQTTSGDYLQGLLRGTRKALYENDRESMTVSLPVLNATTLGAVIALFERAVGYYASLVHINAYHQPGVEAGKKAAATFLQLFASVRDALAAAKSATADQIAAKLSGDPEEIYHCLTHLAANDSRAKVTLGNSPGEDLFDWSAGA